MSRLRPHQLLFFGRAVSSCSLLMRAFASRNWFLIHCLSCKRLSLASAVYRPDVWFWREQSMSIWERIRSSPGPYNEVVHAEWEFEQIEGRARGRMFVNKVMKEARDEAYWPEAYSWLGKTLSSLYENVAPMLREEMDLKEAVS